jgi:hypothetical protein
MDGGVALARFILLCGLALATGVAGRGAEPWPVAGGVAGELKLEFLPELGLGWSVDATRGGVVLRAVRPGVAVEVRADWPDATGMWKWRVERGEVDLAEMWPMLREQAGAAAAGWSASGKLVFGGEGTWSLAVGAAGRVTLLLREGWARSDELGMELSGLEMDVATEDLAGGSLPPGQMFRVAKIEAAGVQVGKVAAEFGLSAAAERVSVAQLGAEVLGGMVKLKPFDVVLARPAVTAAVEVDGVALAEIARLVPWAVAGANGNLAGRIKLDWDAVKGLRIQDGGLKIVKTDAAEFRLAPSPGFLTGSMPRRFTFLPASWGKWTKVVGPVNPAYGSLRAIEMGEVGLKIEELTVEFKPEAGEDGRSATVRVLGRPTNTEFVDEVTLQVNFHGPLADALALGLGDQVKLNWR